MFIQTWSTGCLPNSRMCSNIRTYYEQRWLEEGKNIHYLRTRV